MSNIVYLATVEYRGYELRCCAATEEAARKAILEEIRRCNRRDHGGDECPMRYEGDMGPERFWEYMGGHVTEMPLGDVVWP